MGRGTSLRAFLGWGEGLVRGRTEEDKAPRVQGRGEEPGGCSGSWETEGLLAPSPEGEG